MILVVFDYNSSQHKIINVVLFVTMETNSELVYMTSCLVLVFCWSYRILVCSVNASQVCCNLKISLSVCILDDQLSIVFYCL